MLGNFMNTLGGQQSSVQGGQQLPAFNSAFSGYGNLANAAGTGGFDPTNYANTLAGYNNFASTGGFTPAQETAYMDQATSGVANTYGVLQNQAALQRAKTGGMGGGGEISQMARQLAQAQAGAEQGAAVNLNQMENANKLAGLSGSSSLQTAQAGNVLSGLQGAASGMGSLYNTATGEFTQLGQQMLGAYGIDSSNQAAALDALTKLATGQYSSQGILGNIQQIGGMAVGALAGMGL
jgi:hypothetical protein